MASRNRVARLMRQEQLWARQRSKYRLQTTNSRHREPIAPNRLLKLVPRRRDQIWPTDATCVLTGQGWFFVVALLDLYTRRVVGWAMHENLDADLAIEALLMALAQRRPASALIVHSVVFWPRILTGRLSAACRLKTGCPQGELPLNLG